MTRYHPLKELTLSRFKEFIREPEAVFWTYGFPLLLAIGLGIAFRDKPADRILVDVCDQPGVSQVFEALKAHPEVDVEVHPEADCRERLRLGKTSLAVLPGPTVTYLFDPARPESSLARRQVDEILQRAAGRKDPLATTDSPTMEPGARYIDFLIPGLLGMNLMGGGLWGVGFVIVDLRVRKLLKRLLATPMKRTDFLWAIIGGRMVFAIPELLILLGAGALLFDLPIKGNLLAVLTLGVTGALCFAGLGLLVASRAQRIESVTGLMNLVMLPMWLLSGIFFSPERFPDLIQPLVQALPLTQLNYALRAVILEGATLFSQAWRILILAAWTAVSFLLALRWFRWN